MVKHELFILYFSNIININWKFIHIYWIIETKGSSAALFVSFHFLCETSSASLWEQRRKTNLQSSFISRYVQFLLLIFHDDDRCWKIMIVLFTFWKFLCYMNDHNSYVLKIRTRFNKRFLLIFIDNDPKQRVMFIKTLNFNPKKIVSFFFFTFVNNFVYSRVRNSIVISMVKLKLNALSSHYENVCCIRSYKISNYRI